MFSKDAKTTAGIRTKQKFVGSEQFWCYLMLAIPVIGFLVLQVYPILWTFKWSFFSYYGVDQTARFIGLDNFKTFFTQDFTYWKAWGNTLLFAVIKMPIELSLAMLIALILNKKLRGTGLFQAIYFLPHIISTAIIGLILSSMFSYSGIINNMLVKIGLISENIDWFATKGSAVVMIVAGSIWSTFGVNVMYLLAALATVPEDVYESASIDGASSARKFFSITLPLIAPVFQTILLLSLLGSLMFIKTGGITIYATFKVLSGIHLDRSLYALMLVHLFGVPVINIYLIKGNIETLPIAIDEAAKIDGCSFPGIFLRVILPLLATVAILSFNSSWNDYLMPNIFTLTNPMQRTLIVGLMALKSSGESASAWNLMLAGATIALIPILVVFAFLNKYFVKGIANGAVKG